jgi:hypothetical protein
MLGCKYEERHNPNLGDLSYITDYSSSRQDVMFALSLYSTYSLFTISLSLYRRYEICHITRPRSSRQEMPR